MNILHLSDFHISSRDSNLESLLKNINDALELKGKDFYPDILLLTGDYTELGSSDQYKWFVEKFQHYQSESAFLRVNHVMALPGNHDFPWDSVDTRTDQFRSFCDKVEIGMSKTSDSSLDNILKKHMMKYLFVSEPDCDFLLIGMNSMKIDSPVWPGIGFFEKDQFRAVHKLVDFYKEQSDNLQIMAAFHHHLVPVSVLERDTLDNSRKFSLTLDARRAIDCFLDNDISVAVHGHQHQPSVITWKDEERNDQKQLHIVSSGCLAGKGYAGEGARSSFMLYTVNPDGIIISKAETTESDSDRFRWEYSRFFPKKSKILLPEHRESDNMDAEKYERARRAFEAQLNNCKISKVKLKKIEWILRDALTGNRDKRRQAHILMINSSPLNRDAMKKCLNQFMKSENEFVRGEAYYCIGTMKKNNKNHRNEEIIAAGLNDESNYVKACCANVLTRLSPLEGETVKKLRSADDLYYDEIADNARKSLHYYAQLAISRNK